MLLFSTSTARLSQVEAIQSAWTCPVKIFNRKPCKINHNIHRNRKAINIAPASVAPTSPNALESTKPEACRVIARVRATKLSCNRPLQVHAPLLLWARVPERSQLMLDMAQKDFSTLMHDFRALSNQSKAAFCMFKRTPAGMLGKAARR